MTFLHGMGHFHPPTVIDNAFLESLDIGTSEEWIMERVGIRTRRTVLPLDYLAETHNVDPTLGRSLSTHTHTQTAAAAAEMALERAGLTPGDIGLVISGTSSNEVITPSEACTIAAHLGIDAPSFDINSACTTLSAQLHFLASMKPESQPEFILLCLPETATAAIDYRDRAAAVLFGDVSTAAVVSLVNPAPVKVTATAFHTRPAKWKRVSLLTGGHFSQEGRPMQKFAVKHTCLAYRELASHLGEGDRPPFFIAQQASLPLLESVCNLLDITEEQHLHNAAEYGSCGAAGAPSVLSQNWNRFRPGDRILVATAGAGLAWGGFLVEFAEENPS
jgi:3-oxoacyl-[acyl-carrier-protein] synthase III